MYRLSRDESSGEVRLYIEKSLVSDRGMYAVHVASGSGRATSQLTVDVISQLPVFVQGLSDQTVITGQPAKFTAVVRGIPRPVIRWFICDVEVADTTDKYIISYNEEDGRTELTIVLVSSSDVGLTCECRASSEAGEASSLAVLLPGWCHGKPVIPACTSRTLRVMG